MENNGQNLMQSQFILLSDGVVFNPMKRTLSCKRGSVSIAENESCLLNMLLIGTCSKREVMNAIWEARGIIVTDSSYYKLVGQLRNSFKQVGLSDDLIVTLPRIGVSYIGSKQYIPSAMKKNKLKNCLIFLKDKLSESVNMITVTSIVLSLLVYVVIKE